MSAVAETVDVKAVEEKVAELSRLVGISLRLQKSKHFEWYHVHSYEDGQWMGFISGKQLKEILYWINVIISLEQMRSHAKT